MPKKYPWQRWPDHRTASNKRSHPDVQDKESSWKKSSVEDIKKGDGWKKANSKTFKVYWNDNQDGRARAESHAEQFRNNHPDHEYRIVKSNDIGHKGELEMEFRGK